MTPEFKLYTVCLTYNQPGYIVDTMNGFVIQKTDFPFLCLIIDDASTDGEQQVIRDYITDNFILESEQEKEYAHILSARHKTNQSCFFTVLFLKVNHGIGGKKRGYFSEWVEDVEYEAFCEGDDYWIDPLKLQKQVDYLDSHPECGMCYTNFNNLNQDKGTMLLDVANSSPVEFPMHYTLEQFIMKKGYVCPPSWVYRRKNFLTIQRLKNSCDGTFEIFCHFLATTKVQYLDFISSVYRVLKESASHCSDVNKLAARRKSMLQMQKDLIDKYGLPPELVRECSLKYYKNNLTFHLDNGFLDDVAEARAYLQKEASFKERIIFFLSDSRTGMFIYRQIRKITTLYRH